MHRLLTFKRLSVLFLASFAACFALILAYEHFVRAPGERCEEQGKWWDREGRVCAQPISIAEITGRPNGISRAEASRQKNRELVAIERQLVANDKAVAADADRQRAALKAEQER
ncbi:MAG: hypothetical protein KJ676_14345 [Alphaproteobacteria bacterium]|nr:hypothetical protein [Alphaproteobacteria bacterium]MBU1526685.1 hypothetical protein [Alphaproteobacteria bacterium]MBU2117627.1 hypothetical protein [Alphaproteobacteria bacterium]MBU2350193.1 hypothetical protein [Alphaproteobacteria bacterium]MBU2383542.1 hypothetical protein [Alphaproteobacteria bacterium]